MTTPNRKTPGGRSKPVAPPARTPRASRDKTPASAEAPQARSHSRSFYAEARQRAVRPDDAHAFVSDPAERQAPVTDDLAEQLAEQYVASATSGADAASESVDDIVPEEVGGPFVLSSSEREFAPGTDASNPPDAEVEPFPAPMKSPARGPRSG